jgi:hypothetical protein
MTSSRPGPWCLPQRYRFVSSPATLVGDVASAEHAIGPIRGIVTSEEGPRRCVASIPAGGMINPLTGVPTVAALAMLVDHIGGLVNHHRRGPGEWTVSSELSLELAPNALAQLASAPEVPVIGTGRPCWRNDPNALGLCEFTHRDSVVVTATVRSFHIQPPGHLAPFPDGPTGPLQPGSLADRMAVRVAERRCGEGPRTGPGPGAQQQPSRRARQGVRSWSARPLSTKTGMIGRSTRHHFG